MSQALLVDGIHIAAKMTMRSSPGDAWTVHLHDCAGAVGSEVEFGQGSCGDDRGGPGRWSADGELNPVPKWTAIGSHQLTFAGAKQSLGSDSCVDR